MLQSPSEIKILICIYDCLLGEMISMLTTWVCLVAAVIVAKKETWRRREIWKRVHDFHALTGIPITSPIISLIVGSEEKALQASRFSLSLSCSLCMIMVIVKTATECWSFWNRHLLRSGFHVTAIRPPTVPPNSCRFVVCLILLTENKGFHLLIASFTHV